MDDDQRTDDEHAGDRPRRVGLAPVRPDPVPERVPRTATASETGPEPRLRDLVGRVLREQRRRRGDRLVDVAERAGVSSQYLSEIERGLKDPSSEIVSAVAGAVGLGLDGLLAELARLRGIEVVERVPPPVLLVQQAARAAPAAAPRTDLTCLAA